MKHLDVAASYFNWIACTVLIASIAASAPPTSLRNLAAAVGGNLELYINHRLIRRDSLAIMPAVDRGMPLFLGGTDATGQRWGGQVRELWLGNIP